MFKRIFAFVLTFVMAASLFTVNAADNEVFKGERGEFSYFIDGEAFDPSEKIPAGKTVNVKVHVKNDMSSSRYFTLLTALYNGEGAMVTVKNTQPLWLGNDTNSYGKSLTLSITAPAEPVSEMYDVKSFVWENTSTLIPCKTVVTDAPKAPFAVSVANAKERSVIRWPNIAKQNGGKLGETKDVYGYTVYRDGVEIGTAQQSSNEFIFYHDTTSGRGGEYSVTAYGLNDGEESMGVKDVTKSEEYNTLTLTLDDVENFLNTTTTDDWKAVSNGTVKLTNYYTTGSLGVYEQEGGGMNTYTAYDKNFATNKTANTYGFCEIEADGVKKKCLATKDLKEGKICIAVPDGEVLSSAKKIVKLTVLDNAEKVLRLRYATSGKRQHFEYKLTGKGGWVTLLAAIDDTYTGPIANKGYVFELGYGTEDKSSANFSGETYIADISISAPKQASAE